SASHNSGSGRISDNSALMATSYMVMQHAMAEPLSHEMVWPDKPQGRGGGWKCAGKAHISKGGGRAEARVGGERVGSRARGERTWRRSNARRRELSRVSRVSRVSRRWSVK